MPCIFIVSFMYISTSKTLISCKRRKDSVSLLSYDLRLATSVHMIKINRQEISKNQFGLFYYNLSKSITWDFFSNMKYRTMEVIYLFRNPALDRIKFLFNAYCKQLLIVHCPKIILQQSTSFLLYLTTYSIF